MIVMDVMIARQSARLTVDGEPVRVRRGSTTAHADHPIVTEHPELWRVLPIDFPVKAKVAPVKKDTAD